MNLPIKLKQWLGWGVIILVALMPFHAFAVTWGATFFDHRSLLQTWKEALLVFMCIPGAWLLYKNDEARQRIKRPVNLAIVVFAIIGLLVSIATKQFGTRNFWFGIKIDLEFLLAFVLAQLAASEKLEKTIKWILITTSSIVAAIGILQIYVLPKDILARFGYGPATIVPFEQVDPAIKNIRILSTLGGPNQLGAFMILPICLFVFMLVRRRTWWAVAPLVACTIVLIHTYSRSAWLGALLAVVVTLGIGLSKKWLAITAAAGLVIVFLVFQISRSAVTNRTNLQYFVLHGSVTNGKILGSDTGRISSLQTGITTLRAHPLGLGYGSTGPATLNTQSANVTEDMYLQIGIEAGLLGLLAFVTFEILLGLELFQVGLKSDLAPALIGALCGIAVINLFLHGWADSSTSIVYWSSAGAVIGWRKIRV